MYLSTMGVFTHLHVHSHFSFCRGTASIKQLCEKAAEMGMTHLAITDRNGIYGLGWFLQEARRTGIKPLIGAELVTTRNRCVMLAKNHSGYAHLCNILRRLHNEKDLDLKTEVALSSNVVVISDDTELLAALTGRRGTSDLYVEVVPFRRSEHLLQFSRQHDLPVVATADAYLLSPRDWFLHKLLRAIDLNTTLQRLPAREVCHPRAWFCDTSTIKDALPYAKEAISNSRKIALDCSFNFGFGHFVFASYPRQNGKDAQSILCQRVEEGAQWRYGHISDTVRRRINYELKLIHQKGFAPYFLVVADIVAKAPRTCGRGSAAASIVSYTLGITHIDPIAHDLFFDRFLNPGRIDPPDIDVDFPWDERDDVLDFIFSKYGSRGAAMISNHNGFKARSAVREVAKVYGIPETEINNISKRIAGYYQPGRLSDYISVHPVFKHIDLTDPWPEILQYAERIRGFPRYLSVHCGGVVIAPDGMDNYVPVQPAKKILNPTGSMEKREDFPRSSNGIIPVIQWEKEQAEEMGLIKIDILGNRSLAVIRDTLIAVQKNTNTRIDYAGWNPLEDKKTRATLAKGETIGVFYVESPAMRQLQRKTGCGDFEHLVIHSSIIRPAANDYIDEYVRRLKGGAYKPLHPVLEALLKETYGIMVYQEDVSKAAMALAGFSSADADHLRKIISKKNKEEKIQHYKDRFYAGAKKKGVERQTIEKIWHMIESFSGYSFCKPHSASYALVSFKSAYLRAHFPAEFMAAVISNRGGYYSTFAYISEARRMGIKVLMPDINKSEMPYTGKNREIRVGLMQLQNLSHRSAKALLTARRCGGDFTGFDDFMGRVKIQPSDVTILIKAGCFDSLDRNRPKLLWRLKWYQSERKMDSGSTLSLFDQESETTATLPSPPPFSEKELIRFELETLGFLISRHPLWLYKDKTRDVIRGKDLDNFTGKRVRLLGWLVTRKMVSTKNQQMMEFMSFEDTSAIYETVFFPKAYQKFVHMISYTRPYLLEGRVDESYGAVSVNVERIGFL
jgi:error-prone DNA polymerase